MGGGYQLLPLSSASGARAALWECALAAAGAAFQSTAWHSKARPLEDGQFAAWSHVSHFLIARRAYEPFRGLIIRRASM